MFVSSKWLPTEIEREIRINYEALGFSTKFRISSACPEGQILIVNMTLSERMMIDKINDGWGVPVLSHRRLWDVTA